MPELPDGTVTFLFTDIEKSTELWEKYPSLMGHALARHDALIRQAIGDNGGAVFKTIGDAFCAAFPTASAALNAALQAQQALNKEFRCARVETEQSSAVTQDKFDDSLHPSTSASPESPMIPIPLCVRMALHTGAAELRDGDYFGQPLNRVARLLAAGYGGQVLLSLPTEELARDTLPPGVSLRNLEAHRLRDLSRPETVFQLLHPALPSVFPPLRSLDNPALPNNLPLQLTSFIGREKEIAAVKTLLANTRLLTLTGAGGGGKTRLALQVAADALEQYPDGVWLVELAPITEPGLVIQAVASVLGVKEQTGQPMLQTLRETLKHRHLMLVLDNCEHLIAACAQLASALLLSCPQVKVLATGREALSVRGEQTYRVPSLSLPDPRQAATPQNLDQCESVRLFSERAMLVKSDFAITGSNAAAVAQLCYRLDGIPLALELAAARARSLAIEDINSKLDNLFRLLTGGDRSAMPRQQTLRALIDWSYDLLSAREKLLLSRLSVFAGGWTLQAAEQVGAGDSAEGDSIEDWEVLDTLTNLVDKSLVTAEEQASTVRYRLLATVQQYAAEKMQASGEAEAVRARHRDCFLALAEEAEPQLAGAEQGRWLSRLEREHENLRIALTWCYEDPAGAEKGLRLAGALWNFWQIRGYFLEGRQQLERALHRSEAKGSASAREKALLAAGNLAWTQGDYPAARTFFEEALAVGRKLQDTGGIANSLNALGGLAWAQGDYKVARELYEESLSVHRQLKDSAGIASALNTLGVLAWSQGQYEEARELHEEGLTLFKSLRHRAGIAWSLGNLGNVACDRSDYQTARSLYEQSLEIRRELGDRSGMAWSLNNLGAVTALQGEHEEARSLYEQSLLIFEELGNKSGVAHSLSNLGTIACEQGAYKAAQSLLQRSLALRRDLGDRQGAADSLEGLSAVLLARAETRNAVSLWGTAHALRESIHSPLPLNKQEKYSQQLAQARMTLGEDAFAAAWEEGCRLSWERAAAHILEEHST